MKQLHYIVIYRNGVKTQIADLYRTDEGKFVFEYVEIQPINSRVLIALSGSMKMTIFGRR